MTRIPLVGCAIACLALRCAGGSRITAENPLPQSVRNTPAELPADVPPVIDKDVTFAVVRGMQVLVKRIPTAEVVAAQLYIKGGVRNWLAENAGIEQLALSVASRGGTESLNKDAFFRKLAALGSSLGASAGNDYSGWGIKSLRENWDATFALLVEAFLRPALPPSEIELQRTRQLSALKHELESPDARLGLALHHLLYKGHPYENRAIGTAESVSRLNRDQLVTHLTKLRQMRRLVLVVVGNVAPDHVIEAAREAFSKVPIGSYVDVPLPKLQFTAPRVEAIEVALPTNYIEAIFNGPGWSDPDFPIALVSMSVLNWRLFEEVRTKRNLSYAPSASFNANSAVPRGVLYVTATDPKATIAVMFDQAKHLKATSIASKELAGDKSIFLTGLLTQNEATDGQADLLGRALLYGGDYKLARTLPEHVRAVSPSDVQTFAKRYIHNLQVVALGDKKKLDPALLGSL